MLRARMSKAVSDTPEIETNPSPKSSQDAPETSSAPSPWKHRIRGGVVMLLGLTGTFLLMANGGTLPRGTLLGMLSTLIAVCGFLDLAGLFTNGAPGIPARETSLFPIGDEFRLFAPLYAAPLALVLLLVGGYFGGYEVFPAVITAALFCLFPAALRRPGLMVFVVVGLLYLPFLGVYGLWDPWETHYGEVAREILSRDDWISLWWAQDGWFWSKPILIFWVEALSMGAFGVDFHPDANPLHPEWAIRLPIFLLSLGALYAVFGLVARVWSKRAGLITALVLATMPHFFLLAHQSITDMPFVACMTMAVCMLGFGIVEDPEREIGAVQIGSIRLTLQQAVLTLLLLISVPQILYLVSRNVTLMDNFLFSWHGDFFASGSAGNGDVAGNQPINAQVAPAFSSIFAQPIAQALMWFVGLCVLVVGLLRERRVQGLYIFAFYIFCGLAFMAKGIPGFALPGLVALFFLIASRRWSLLLEGRFRVALGALTVIVTGLPWYVAMYLRHGPPFTQRLLVHDHINRLTTGVHGDTGSIQYFIEQMGYGLFPWIGLAPLALGAWLTWRRPEGADEQAERAQRSVLLLFTLWLAAAFTLFSAMTTKFHHYIFPTVPAAGVLVGVTVDRLLGPVNRGFSWRRTGSIALSVIAPVPAIVATAAYYGDLRGWIPQPHEGTDWVLEQAVSWPWLVLGWLVAFLIGFLAWRWGQRVVRENSLSNDLASSSWQRITATTGLLAATVLIAFIGRDLSWVTASRPQGYERLILLFVYKYERLWPAELDYRPALTGFAVVAAFVIFCASIKSIRRVAVVGFLSVALLFTAWTLDVYMIDLSRHWGQRELVQRYYQERTGPEEPLLAWQMNWKGENFYSGNRVQVFVQLDNQQLREWLGQHSGESAYFLLEHTRLPNFRNVMRGSEIEPVTNLRDCNKFILVHVNIAERRASLADAPNFQSLN